MNLTATHYSYLIFSFPPFPWATTRERRVSMTIDELLQALTIIDELQQSLTMNDELQRPTRSLLQRPWQPLSSEVRLPLSGYLSLDSLSRSLFILSLFQSLPLSSLCSLSIWDWETGSREISEGGERWEKVISPEVIPLFSHLSMLSLSILSALSTISLCPLSSSLSALFPSLSLSERDIEQRGGRAQREMSRGRWRECREQL